MRLRYTKKVAGRTENRWLTSYQRTDNPDTTIPVLKEVQMKTTDNASFDETQDVVWYSLPDCKGITYAAGWEDITQITKPEEKIFSVRAAANLEIFHYAIYAYENPQGHKEVGKWLC